MWSGDGDVSGVYFLQNSRLPQYLMLCKSPGCMLLYLLQLSDQRSNEGHRNCSMRLDLLQRLARRYMKERCSETLAPLEADRKRRVQLELAERCSRIVRPPRSHVLPVVNFP